MTDLMPAPITYPEAKSDDKEGPIRMSPSEEKKLLSMLDGWFTHCTKARTNFERQWYYNMAFYFGKQWVQWVGGSSANSNNFTRLVEPAAPNWRVRLVTNKIRRYVRTELTKLNKERTQWYVKPKTTEDTDVAGARAAEQLSEYLFDITRFPVTKRRATFWMLLLGSSFLKSSYDDNAVGSDKIPGLPVLDAVNAFHLFAPDLQEEEIEGQPYLIHTSTKSQEWVYDTFGVRMEADVAAGSNSLEQKFLNALSLKGSENSKYVYVKEAWIKPQGEFPNGALITWAGSHILAYYDAWPYQNPAYPFAKMDHIPTGRFYGDSIIVDLIPLQKEVNRTKSQLVEAKNRMARPQLIAPKGSIDANKVTSEPGLIVFYQPGFVPPAPMPLTQIPQYVIEELDRGYKDMDDLAGQYEITQGRTPPGVEAASAIAYLQEENDTLLLASVASIEEAIEKTGQAMLSLVDQFWDVQRTITVTGENNAFETYLFSNSNIAGNTDFKVEAGSSIPRSRAARQAFLMDLASRGFIQPDRLLRYLDMMETNRMFDESQVSIRQAQRENTIMRMSPPPQPQMPMQMPGQEPPPPQPPPVQVNIYDDHIEHINTHSIFMRTQQYEQLPDEVKNIFMQHLQQHIITIQSGQSIDQLLQTAPQVPAGPQEQQPGQPQPEEQVQNV